MPDLTSTTFTIKPPDIQVSHPILKKIAKNKIKPKKISSFRKLLK